MMNPIADNKENATPPECSRGVTNTSVSEASFWDESQIQAVIRHAGVAGRSPEEFFNKKWKRVLCHRRTS